jgi:hypothetical protein
VANDGAKQLELRKLELQYQLRFRMVDAVSKAIDRLVPGVVGVLIAYFGIYRTVHDLAGKQSLAGFTLRFFADVRPNEIIAWALALLGWVFGIEAQRLRRNVTERLTFRIQELEQRLDPGRTTSGLTPRGQTPPEV